MKNLDLLGEQWIDIGAKESRVFFDKSPDIFVVSDTATRKILRVNPAYDRVFPADSKNAASFVQLIHPEDRQYVLNVLMTTAIDETSVVECRCLAADGKYLWFQWLSFRVVEQGKSYAIGRDINARKEAELRSQQLAALVEFSADAIIGVGPDNVIRSWNRGAVDIFGYTHSQAEGLSVSQLFEHESYGRLREAGPSGAEKDVLCMRADGSRFCASLLVSDVLDHDHRRVGYSVIIRNITERKEMETRVKEFYSTVSHELRTPLTSIRGALALISGGIIQLNSPEALDLVNVAQESSLRLIRLINDILDIQKIESGKLELAKTVVAPDELLRKAINETAGMAKAMGILLTTNCDKDLANLSVDVDKVVQVLTNLVSNAIKFSPDGEKVDVDIRRTDQSIRFSVRDRGFGIPEDQSHKLFKKFQQLDSSDSRQQGGTGLGLAISKSLVEQHSGTIGFCNEEKGCTFWFELPASDYKLLKTETSNRKESSMSAPHVLIVEDDEQLAYVMAAQLKVIGCTVTVVGDVASGTRFLAEQQPDLMLLDLLLPDGNGTEIVEYLESLAPKDRVPIVIVSGLANSETNCRSRSIVEWVQKPFQIDDLLQVVQRATSTFAPATVAVIDDDDLLRQVIDVQLSQAGIKCLHAADGLEALELIENHTLDLLILDLSMPRLDGHNLIEVLRRAKCETPLLLYSGQELSCVQVNDLQLGPTMSLTKGRSSQDDFLKAVFTLLKNRSAVSAGESNFRCA